MDGQLPLFKRKSFPAVLMQGIGVVAPKEGSSVLSTLPAYFVYLQSQGYSKYTPSDFCGDVKKFGLFLRSKTLKDITTQDIRGWVSGLRSKEHMTQKTISRKLTAINNYFTWLVVEKVINANPAMAIPNGKIISPLPEFLYDAECNKLLEAASGDCRTYLLILILLETGIKTEELMALELSHIDTSNKYAPEVWIKHSGKKVKKDRKLKLPREVVHVLSEYVEEYEISGCLFPYTRRFIGMLLEQAGKRAGLQKQVSAHLLRDTCAVRLLRSGEPVEAVLKKLGLSETTWEDAKEKYLKLTSRAL
jgi:integrase/recombinase XerD